MRGCFSQAGATPFFLYAGYLGRVATRHAGRAGAGQPAGAEHAGAEHAGRGGLRRPGLSTPAGAGYARATASISTRAPLGRALTSRQERAG